MRDLPRLSGSFDLERRGAAVHVRGRVSALVGQTCVVSLEPMESAIDEPVDVTFAPPPPGAEASESEALGHQLGEAEEEPPEPLIGGAVDLGALATEFMMLGIDPYPRKPGATFTPPNVGDEGAHPFAALAALKKRPGGEPLVSGGQATAPAHNRLVSSVQAVMVAPVSKTPVTQSPALAPPRSTHAG